MAGIQPPGAATLHSQGPAGGASSVKPWTDLNRPRPLPLPGGAAGEGEFRLRERDVLADLQTDAPGAPFRSVGFVMRMAGDADHAAKQIPAPACEVVLNHFVTLSLADWSAVVAGESFRFHQMLERVEFLSIHVAPPGFRWRQVMEIITPFAKL